MAEQESSLKRIAFVLSALTGEELTAGARDVTQVYTLLTDPQLGMCANTGPGPIIGCGSLNEFWSHFFPILKEWRGSDQLIFYFSGHGSVRGNYCLELGSDYLPFDGLRAFLASYKVHRAIIIIDACHSGEAIKGIKGTENIFSTISPETIPSGIAIIASSRSSQTSHELPDGSASVFTHLLCEGIETGLDGQCTPDGLISIDDIVGYIRKKLVSDERYSAFYQRPVFQVNEADREIWIAKNRSGAIAEHQGLQVNTPKESDYFNLRNDWERILSMSASSKRSGSLNKATHRFINKLKRTCIDSQDINPLITATQNKNYHIRRFAVKALGEMCSRLELEDETVIPHLLRVINEDKDMGTRWRAVWALGAIRPQKHREIVRELFVNILGNVEEDNTVRWRAAWALGEIKAVESEDLLIRIAIDTSNNKNIRRAAIRALGTIKSFDAQPALEEIANKDSEKIGKVAKWALLEIDSRRKDKYAPN